MTPDESRLRLAELRRLKASNPSVFNLYRELQAHYHRALAKCAKLKERARRLQDVEFNLAKQSAEADESDYGEPGMSVLMHDSGGGRRVIRSTRGLS
jgi:hypothetical protein